MCFLYTDCERCNHTKFSLSMYKIACGHYICKTCIKEGVRKCRSCDKSYYVSNVKKTNVSTFGDTIYTTYAYKVI